MIEHFLAVLYAAGMVRLLVGVIRGRVWLQAWGDRWRLPLAALFGIEAIRVSARAILYWTGP